MERKVDKISNCIKIACIIEREYMKLSRHARRLPSSYRHANVDFTAFYQYY